MRDTREKRDLHALDPDGMVLCNPRDREAAHRAEVEGIATAPPRRQSGVRWKPTRLRGARAVVTCKKCLALLHSR